MAQADAAKTPKSPLPQGYRESLVTAITVFLGFSLYFARWWNLEIPGEWTWKSVVPACIITIGIVVQLVALFRSLDIRDDDESHYRRTVHYFFIGIVIVLAGVLLVHFVA